MPSNGMTSGRCCAFALFSSSSAPSGDLQKVIAFVTKLIRDVAFFIDMSSLGHGHITGVKQFYEARYYRMSISRCSGLSLALPSIVKYLNCNIESGRCHSCSITNGVVG